MVGPGSMSDEVELLIRNAQLRDELEPFFDESISRLNSRMIPTNVENEYLAGMLAWERAPSLPIRKWFQPELQPLSPERLSNEELSSRLMELVQLLFEKRIVLDFTDHLSDRQLYTVIYRDILPTYEKKIEGVENYLHWDCANVVENPQIWLRYYATPQERKRWEEGVSGPMPPAEPPPYPRQLPRRPL